MSGPPLLTEWHDHSLWPGPDYEGFLYSFSAYVRQMGKEWERITKIFSAESDEAAVSIIRGSNGFRVIFDELVPKFENEKVYVDDIQLERLPDQPKILADKLPKKNHGPRPTRQFDKKGRRRY